MSAPSFAVYVHAVISVSTASFRAFVPSPSVERVVGFDELPVAHLDYELGHAELELFEPFHSLGAEPTELSIADIRKFLSDHADEEPSPSFLQVKKVLAKAVGIASSHPSVVFYTTSHDEDEGVFPRLAAV